MIKKKIQYIDFNGIEREDDFYFHLSLPEVTRLQAKYSPEAIDEYILRIAREDDVEGVLRMMEDIILGAYGIKTVNGKSFIKTPEATKEFEYSEAYASLFEELLTDPESLKKFAAGVGALNKTETKPTMTVAE